MFTQNYECGVTQIMNNLPENSADFSETENTAEVLEILMDFTETLFYNFKTTDIFQKAFEQIAAYLQICKATVWRYTGTRIQSVISLYETGVPVDDKTQIEEKQMHAATGDHFIYRLYRCGNATALTHTQRRVLEHVFKTLHTYLNRQISFETAQYALTHDMVYRCLNTNGLKSELERYRNEGLDFRGYATVFMNVCKFKTINTKIGFENGNKVLHHIVNYLKDLLDEEECFAHVGGDNFSLFLKQDTLDKKLQAIDGMSCDIMHEGMNHRLRINFNMGVFRIDTNEEDIPHYLENANIALGFAKQSETHNIVQFNQEKRTMYEFSKMLENSLIPALHNGDFQVYYQPKVELDSFCVTGAEALSRWFHNGSAIRPDSFIPIFERNGMIIQIDFHIFTQVCRTIRNWMDNGIAPVTVSVNFSKISLETSGFVNHLLRITEKYGVPSKYLEIEFTETCCMENEEKFNEILAQLKQAGFMASLDDFGKGYSSINMLKNMNFDILKLDRVFLTLDEERGRIILDSIVKMAQDLNIQIISEGVETLEQITYLKKLKCEKAQGYFFDQPLTAEDFTERLHNRHYTMQ